MQRSTNWKVRAWIFLRSYLQLLVSVVFLAARMASIYFEITRKLKFSSNSHIFVTVTIHDKMAFFLSSAVFCAILSSCERPCSRGTWWYVLWRIHGKNSIWLVEFDERFLLRHLKRARLRYDESYGNHNAFYDELKCTNILIGSYDRFEDRLIDDVIINPITPKILLVILLTICLTILIMLVWRIWYQIN